MKATILALLGLSSAVAASAASMLPEKPMEALAKSATSFGDVSVAGTAETPVLRVASPKQTPNGWDFQCLVALHGAVRKGDHLAVSFSMRGASASGDARIAVKLQDKTNRPLIREEPRAGAAWRDCLYTCVAERDYAEGELGFTFFLGLARQSVEIAFLRVENAGATQPQPVSVSPTVGNKDIAALAPLAVPEGEKPIVLPDLDEKDRATKRYILIKLDDIVDGNEASCIHPKIRRVTDFLAERGLPASLGVICNSLERDKPYYIDWIKKNHFRNGGLFDFWQHGWTHQMNIPWKDGKTYFAEYGIPDAAYQRETFDKSQRIFLEKIGHPLEGFCAPCGLITADTRALLREHTEIKTWLYGDMNDPCGKFSFRRTCNLESSVGRVEYNAFIRQYRGQRTRDYIMLQGHPALWSDESFRDFCAIVDQLQKDGWTFTTATQYVELIGWQPPEDALFPFPMGGDAPNAGIADVSFLNDKPAGAHGRVTVQDGHFVDGAGKRLRFLATNFTFSEAFPDHAKADALAARLASMGINAVRIHHIDKHDAPAGIWKKGTFLDTLDPGQLDKLHYFIAALARQGIYTDFNLHVSREYWRGADFSADGLKDNRERDAVLPKYGKGLDRIFTPWIEMQRAYARDVLLAPNPYSGKPLAQDPAVFLVEINNENTLFELKAAELPAFYRAEIERKWNDWLRARYGTTEKLRAAWGSEQPLGDELLAGHAAVVEGPAYLKLREQGDRSAKVDLVAKPDQNWQAQLQWRDLTLTEGGLYTLSFEVRADVPRTVSFTTRHQVADWHNCGLGDSFKAGTEWKRHTQSFTARNVEPALTRLDFPMGGAPLGVLEFRNVSLRPGGKCGLFREESLEDGTVTLANDGLGATQRGKDWTEFRADVERAYGAAMRDFLRRDLGCEALVLDSQASYGGMRGLYREARMDVVDMHSYWQHPSFPGTPWDMNNWAIGNTPMSFAPDFAANLGRLASFRVFGKPFTVSEYDHPAPNAASCEMFPMVASYGALQDWDGIFQFDWGSSQYGENKIGRFFDLQNHAGKLAFLPAAAMVFRSGAVKPLHEKFSAILPFDDFAKGVDLSGDPLYVLKSLGATTEDFLASRIGLEFTSLPREPKPGITAGPRLSPLSWSETKPFALDTPSAKVLAGRVPGAKHDLDGATFEVAKNESGFVAIALTAMDGKPLRESSKTLLAIAGNVENTGMGWNGRHTSVGTKWGGAPTVAEGIEARVTVSTVATSATVYALDGKGNRVRDVPSTLTDGKLSFQTGAEFKTLWYEIEAR